MIPRFVSRSVVVASALFVAGCGIPIDDGPTPLAIPEERDPASTTTTTVPPRPGQAEGKLIYFISDDVLQPVEREIPEPASNQGVFDTLIAGPTEEELSLGVGTGLPDTFEARVVLNDDVLTVEILNEEGLQIEGALRILVFAQIVFTAHFSTNATGGVLFSHQGEFLQALNGAGELQELGLDGVPLPLKIEDFPELRATVSPVPL